MSEPGLDHAFLRYIGATPESQRRIQAFYVPRFAGCERVLDLGCGSGDFLGLLAERGIAGLGVDSDPQACMEARARGLSVECADARAYVQAAPEAEFDGVFCAHLVEHLPYADVLNLVRGARRVLRPGGRLVLVTPNARAIFAHLEMYYRHFGHESFYHPQLLAFFLDHAGFAEVETGENPTLAGLEWGDLRGRVLAGGTPSLRREAIERVLANLQEREFEGRVAGAAQAAGAPLQPVAFRRELPAAAGGLVGAIVRRVKNALAQWLVLPYLDEIVWQTNADFARLQAGAAMLQAGAAFGLAETRISLAELAAGVADLNTGLRAAENAFAMTAERLGYLVGALEQIDASWECYATAVRPREEPGGDA